MIKPHVHHELAAAATPDIFERSQPIQQVASDWKYDAKSVAKKDKKAPDVISKPIKYQSQQTKDEEQRLKNAANIYWIETQYPDTDMPANVIAYPPAIQFDLSLNIAKKTLAELSHIGNRIESVYDEDGNLLHTNFIAGMDDEAADFYIRTMSKNLRGCFNRIYDDKYIEPKKQLKPYTKSIFSSIYEKKYTEWLNKQKRNISKEPKPEADKELTPYRKCNFNRIYNKKYMEWLKQQKPYSATYEKERILRAHKPCPAHYATKLLFITAKKGLIGAQTSSGLNGSQIRISFLSNTKHTDVYEEDIEALMADGDTSREQALERLDEKQLSVVFAPHARGTLARKQRRYIETIALHSGLIGYNAHHRCTTYAHKNWEERQDAIEEWMKSKTVSNGKKKFSLAEIGKSKKKTLSEMYTLAYGTQKYAEAQGCVWASIVCTLLPNKHPNPEHGSNKWDGTTPDESNKELSQKFARVRAVLAKHGITLSGLWTREAHKDACPHVNFLVYFTAGDSKIIEEAFRAQFGQSDEAVTWNMSVKGKLKDGSDACNFATYAMKYFMKFLSENPSDDAIDEAAWASTWGLRRYAFIGLPTLEIWRRMRKTREPIKNKYLEELRLACRNNDAAGWIRLCGGLNVKRSKRHFSTIRDAVSKVVIGVKHNKSGAQHINKKIGEWLIEDIKNTPAYDKAPNNLIANYADVCKEVKPELIKAKSVKNKNGKFHLVQVKTEAKNNANGGLSSIPKTEVTDNPSYPSKAEAVEEKAESIPKLANYSAKHPHHKALMRQKKLSDPSNKANYDERYSKIWEDAVEDAHQYMDLEAYADFYRLEWQIPITIH